MAKSNDSAVASDSSDVGDIRREQLIARWREVGNLRVLAREMGWSLKEVSQHLKPEQKKLVEKELKRP